MKPKAGNMDFQGARASNAGDAFHERWVLRKALELLDPTSRLSSLTVEGVPAANANRSNRSWDGVDCTLCYGESEEEPGRIDIVQLKYSPSAPKISFALGRFTKNTRKTGNNSPARRLADAFKATIDNWKLNPEITREIVNISLVTNQPISPHLAKLVERVRNGNPDSQKARELGTATALSKTELKLFCERLELKGDERSRADLMVDVIRKTYEMLDTDVRGTVDELLTKVRERMLPEGKKSPITRETVESWFSIGQATALFPCEAKLQTVEHPIDRAIGLDLAEAVKNNKLVCFHGEGGHGKTVVAQGLEPLLPPGSKVVLYDCFGGGEYRDPSKYRHQPLEAFTQLSNELARTARAPLFFPYRRNPSIIRSFRKRLDMVPDLMTVETPDALLVILVDAADNAVAAASSRTPADECFLHDLVRMYQLPENVRVVVGTRTSRKDSLKLPSGCAEVVCPPFSREETCQFLTRRFPGLSDDSIEDFHYLSGGSPRVQSSALTDRDSFEKAIEFLRPEGKSLKDVYADLVDKVLVKAGGVVSKDFLCAALSVMPSPAPTAFLGAVCKTDEQTVAEVCKELVPLLRVVDREVEFANEDFQHFCEENGAARVDEVINLAADEMFKQRSDSQYASVHLFDFLVAAGRRERLFDLLDEEDATRSISDPVVRNRTDLARLRASLSVVSQYGEDVKTVKTILVGSEARETDWKVMEILLENLDLSARFFQNTVRQFVLNDPEQRRMQGHLLAYLSREYALAGNAPASREAFRQALEKSRSDGWNPEKDEVVAVVTGFYKNDGWKKAEKHCEHCSELLSVFLKYELLKFVALSEGRERIKSIRQEMNRRQRWVACVLVKRCGGEISAEELENDLEALMDFDFGCMDVEEFEKSESLLLVDDLLFFAELCGRRGVDSGRVAELVGKILPRDERKIEHAMLIRPYLIDFCFRAARLENPGENVALEVKNVFQFPEIQRDTDSDSSIKRHRSFEGNIRDAELLLPFYEALAAGHAKKADEDPNGAASGLLEKAKAIFSRARSWELELTAEMIGRRVFDLHIINGTNVDHALDFFKNLTPRAWPFDSLQLAMCGGEFFDKIANLFRTYARDVENSNSRPMEKASALIRISRLLLPVSEPDSRAYFERALKIVEDIDYELIHQLDCLLKMAGRFSEDAPGNRKRAKDTARLVRRAAVLLGDDKNFPYARSMEAIASLSTPVAACILNRWADEGFVETDMYVEIFLRKALSRKTLPASHVAALSPLAGDHGPFLTDSICESARELELPESVGDKILTEVAGRELTNLAPDAPKEMSGQIERLAESLGKPNAAFRNLADAHAFLKSNFPAGKTATESYPLPGTGAENQKKPDWSGVDVLDPDSMSATMETNRAAGYRDEKTYYSALAARVKPGDRIGHLDALARIAKSKPYPAHKASHIADRLKKWEGEAVKVWARKNLPGLLVELSPTIMVHGTETFESLVKASGLPDERLRDTIVAAVEKNAHRASSNGLLKYAAMLVGALPEEQAGEVFDWYVSRLDDRVKVRETSPERHDIPVDDLPDAPDEIAAAVLYRFLGDMDVRLRWRAAHSVRAFVRLGEEGVVPALVRHALSAEPRTYAFGDMPFHELTARLFLAMTLARIAFESPETVAAVDSDVLRLATDGPPHVMIEHYVKRALTQTDKTAGTPRVSADRAKLLAHPLEGSSKLSERRVGVALGSMGMPDGVSFDFDILDTLPYWYDPALEIFADVSPEEFLERADSWIVKQGFANKDDEYRLNDRRRHLSQSAMSRHGGSYLPAEPYPRYLEWHAMCVVVGEFLKTRKLAEHEDCDETSFEEWIKRWDTLYAGAWLSDLRGPIPPEPRYWLRPGMSDPDCLKPPEERDSLAELFTETRGETIISSYRETIRYLSGKREAAQTVRVECSLVPPETAGALLRAFEAARDPWYMEVPNEEDLDDDDEKRIEKFAAGAGALIASHSYDGFDSLDPMRYGTTGVDREPGTRIVESLKLSRPCPWSGTWRSDKSEREICRYEAWSTQPNDDHDLWARSRSDTATDGFRLAMDAESLARALEYLENDLVAVVKTRKSKGDYNEKDRKEVRFVRVYILRRNGTVENPDGKTAGTWLPDSQGHRG